MDRIKTVLVANREMSSDTLRNDILDYQRAIKTLTSALCTLELTAENRHIVTLLLDDLVNDLQKLTALLIEQHR